MAKRILVPTTSYHDWQRLLAQPDRHWKAEYSAMTLARSWEAAGPSGFPPEVQIALDSVNAPELKGLNLLLAIPEFQVSLPGGKRGSQTDVLAIAGNIEGLVIIAVEGKVDEPFGPSVGEKQAEQSVGVNQRLRFLLQRLELPSALPVAIRYQLLHRTVSALLIAEQFHARAAVMLVHSFSPSHKWFADFAAFASLFAVQPVIGEIVAIGAFGGTQLYIGWCQGDQQFRSADNV